MKNLKQIITITALSLITVSCGNDDDSSPEVINEEEVITTLELELVPNFGGETVSLIYSDLDGVTGDDPVYEISGSLNANTTYVGSTRFLNETESPAGNITEEVADESDEHQVLYTVSSDLTAGITYADEDNNGNPLGLNISLTTGEASTGTLTVTLRHEPTKPNDGTLNSAGGETDVQAIFPITIEE